MTKNFLEINNVTFAASAQSKVNNVSLTIENQGDIVCLLGPSGIGKTCLLYTSPSPRDRTRSRMPSSA